MQFSERDTTTTAFSTFEDRLMGRKCGEGSRRNELTKLQLLLSTSQPVIKAVMRRSFFSCSRKFEPLQCLPRIKRSRRNIALFCQKALSLLFSSSSYVASLRTQPTSNRIFVYIVFLSLYFVSFLTCKRTTLC